MRVPFALLLVVGLAACCTAVGDPCKDDDDCGPGFDCYRDRCVRVCTKSEECDKGDTCYRYRCISPSGLAAATTPGGSSSPPAPGMPVAPITVAPSASTPAGRGPMPDAAVAELRAMRRELERMREDQARILQLLEKRSPLPAPAPMAKSSAPPVKPTAAVPEPSKGPAKAQP